MTSDEATSDQHEHHLNAQRRQAGEDVNTQAEDAKGKKPQGWVERSEYWTWNSFTVSMGTGAVCVLIGGLDFEFSGQRAIGTIFFLLDLLVFLLNLAGLTTRFLHHRRSFLDSFHDHKDGIYIGAVGLSLSTLFVGTIDFAVPYCGFWLVRTMYVVFWCYVAYNLTIAMILECTLRGRYRSLDTITPADCLYVLPLMLSGTIGASLALHLPSDQAAYIVVVSFWLQGLGFLLSVLKLTVWMARSMLLPNPKPDSIPGYMIAVGPPGFTAYAFLSLGKTAVTAFPAAEILQPNGGATFQIINVWWSFLLLGLALYFIFSTLSIWLYGVVCERKMQWGMGWWSFTFPLVGFILACGQLGTQLPSDTFRVIQVVGTCFVALAWLINFPMTIYSVFVSKSLGMPTPESDDEHFFIWDGLRDGEFRFREAETGTEMRSSGVLKREDVEKRKWTGNPAPESRWASNTIDA